MERYVQIHTQKKLQEGKYLENGRTMINMAYGRKYKFQIATTMQLSEGFTKLGYSLLTLGVMAASVLLLAQAMKSLPMGTAYAVWTGIGALGAVIVGIVFFKEPASAGRIFFATLLLVGIVGLKATSH